MEPVALCIHMERDRLMRLSFSALPLGIRLVPVPDADLGQTLAALCGLEPFRADAPRLQLHEEMMVMAHFSDALMDRWLAVFRQNGLQAVRLKAVLTPYNQSWNCGKLHAMLSLEAAFFEQEKRRSR